MGGGQFRQGDLLPAARLACIHGAARPMKLVSHGRGGGSSRSRRPQMGWMLSNLWVRVCVLVAATMLSWPLSATAETGHSFVVIVPSFRPPNPPPPSALAQPAWQWAPPPPLGLTPGIPSPAARCYARTDVCPLTPAGNIGQSCNCGTTTGRALIPPSHDILGRPTG